MPGHNCLYNLYGFDGLRDEMQAAGWIAALVIPDTAATFPGPGVFHMHFFIAERAGCAVFGRIANTVSGCVDCVHQVFFRCILHTCILIL
jgi:hypothetical protein